jgi:hypothetical protein
LRRSVGAGFFGIRTEGDGGEGASEELSPEGAGFFCDEVAEGGHAFVDGSGGDGILAVEFPGGRGGARGEREEMEVGEGLCGDEVVTLTEEGVGFAGESDHDVGTDGGVGEEGADLCEALGVMPGAIAAIHAAEDGVGAGLEREVGVARQTRVQGTGCRVQGGVRICRELAVEGEEVGGPVHGLDGA